MLFQVEEASLIEGGVVVELSIFGMYWDFTLGAWLTDSRPSTRALMVEVPLGSGKSNYNYSTNIIPSGSFFVTYMRNLDGTILLTDVEYTSAIPNSLVDIRSSIFVALREDVMDPVFWDRYEVDDYINTALSLISGQADFAINTALITTQTGVKVCELPPDCVLIHTSPLVQKHRAKFVGGSGAPARWDYYGFGRIVLDPVPDKEYSFEIEYRALIKHLRSDSDVIPAFPELKEAVKAYALYLALSKEGDGKDEAKAATKYVLYTTLVGRMLIRMENMKPGSTMGGGR